MRAWRSSIWAPSSSRWPIGLLVPGRRGVGGPLGLGDLGAGVVDGGGAGDPGREPRPRWPAPPRPRRPPGTARRRTQATTPDDAVIFDHMSNIVRARAVRQRADPGMPSGYASARRSQRRRPCPDAARASLAARQGGTACDCAESSRSSPDRRRASARRSRSSSRPRAPGSSCTGGTPTEGAAVVGADRRPPGATAIFVAADLGTEAACEQRSSPTRPSRLGGLTVLVNNAVAGSVDGHDSTVADMSTAAWEGTLRVNVTAPMWLCRAAHPAHAGGRARLDHQHLVAPGRDARARASPRTRRARAG